MEGFKHIELVGLILGGVLAVVQFVIFLVVKSIHREIDATNKRTDGVEKRLDECWNELNDFKERNEDTHTAIRHEIQENRG